MGFFRNDLPSITSPGALDRRATLRSRVDTQDNLGQPIPAWTDVATVWAAWAPVVGSETQAASQLETLQRGTLRIRFRSDIDATWQVLLGAVVFELEAPPVEVGRRGFLDLRLRSLNIATALP